MLEQIWQYKIQIVPVLIFLMLFEFPAFIRKLKKTFYVPIYFSVYPLRQINQDLSTYLGEDDFYDEGWRLDSAQAEALRRKIIFTSVVSAAIDALAVPLLVGLVAAFLLEEAVFVQFVTVLAVYKVISIILSLRNSHLHILNSKWKNTLLAIIYIAYIGIIVEMLRTSYFWAVPFVTTSDWTGMLSSFSAFVFGKTLAQGLVFAFLVAIFSNFIADRRLREQNVSNEE
ncbi:MAG: hypothetical protein ACH255_21035 [Candidatus Thiodiazotropha sp.]